MKAADLSQPVARKREGQVRWCKSAALILTAVIALTVVMLFGIGVKRVFANAEIKPAPGGFSISWKF